VLADHTKWGKLGFSTFAQLAEADLLITDSAIEKDALVAMRENIASVEVVESSLK
jgi:DeoR/GlpR family transcriptional regulator of sugar metabolism